MVAALAHQQALHEIGQALASKRQEMGLSLEDVALSTNIRTFFLTCMEEGSFEKLPGGIYTTGLARLYIMWLGFDESQCQLWLQSLTNRHVSEDPVKAYDKPLRKAFPPMWIGVGAFVLLSVFSLWMWKAEKKTDDSVALMNPAAERDEGNSHSEDASNTTASLALYARGTTWIKITDDDNTIVHTQLLKKGATVDLTPYIGQNLTVGDGRKVVLYKAGVESEPLSDISSGDSSVLVENRPIRVDE